MRIEFVEISNFRKLLAVRVELTEHTTLFVGANNSGKTSAMVALRHFLVDGGKLDIHDFTLSHWKSINAIGSKWESMANTNAGEMPDLADWESVLPSLDVWLRVADDEIHYVSKLLPTLDWQGGLLGVRLRFEPKKIADLYKEYVTAIADSRKTKAAAKEHSGSEQDLKLWPESLIDFLDRRLRSHFSVHSYVLDPTKCVLPESGMAKPQPLPRGAQPIEGDPFEGLIRIDEINAQRGFGQTSGKPDRSDGETNDIAEVRESRKLSVQLRAYYAKHLDPFDNPDPSDLLALKAIDDAEAAFDHRLKECFKGALKEVESLGYPGITDPKLKISTRIRPTDGLNHDAAVQYEVDAVGNASDRAVLRLPEDSNGLGYQNLISMIFRLMSFRDAWMRVGKAGKAGNARSDGELLPPLHLVLVEEPEAHLHAQVQQVFIRRAYAILRAHPDLGKTKRLATQLVVSTHSSHVAHEPPFACLRYFRRLPAGMAGANVPVSTVANLSEIFGDVDDTQRFVKRYLRVAHCDLFFADAAILVEGPAERMLVPHFVLRGFEQLNQSYITWLEIGGSHAHRLEPLIKHLGLPTLVITDLDAGNSTSGAAEPTARGKGQITNNATLREWAPKREKIDELLDLADADKVVTYDVLSSVRVAYQCPTAITIGGKDGVEALASTFEDALVFENLALFSNMDGSGLIKKFRDAINASQSSSDLGQAMFESLRSGKKAEFALNLLDLKDTDELKVPRYINEGLSWLTDQLKKKQEEVLLTADPSSEVKEKVEAA